MTTDFHHVYQLTESDMLSGKITPLNNVLSGASITLKYSEGLFEFLNTDFSSAYEAVREELSGCQVPDDCHSVAQQYAFTMRKLRPMFYQSLYTAVCPIVLIDTEHLMEAVEAYYHYVVSLQQTLFVCISCFYYTMLLYTMLLPACTEVFRDAQ